MHGGNFAKSSNTNFLCCKHPFPSPIDDEVSNHQQMDLFFKNSIVIIGWGSQSEDVCCMIYASPLMFVESFLLPINMLIGLSFDFKG